MISDDDDEVEAGIANDDGGGREFGDVDNNQKTVFGGDGNDCDNVDVVDDVDDGDNNYKAGNCFFELTGAAKTEPRVRPSTRRLQQKQANIANPFHILRLQRKCQRVFAIGSIEEGTLHILHIKGFGRGRGQQTPFII